MKSQNGGDVGFCFPKLPLKVEPIIIGNTRRLTVGKQSGKAIIGHKIRTILGRPVNDLQLHAVMQKVREIYEGGRKASMREEEFRKVLQDVG